ncbi:hypothetical protein GQ53DRAFT_712073 [Thozetella sp. PMI_491]|nr:hypothetical protein GQ53DRAFT_712073 [Thozetella sp. PMI_491]
MEASCSETSLAAAPLQISFLNNNVVLRYEGSGKYAGLLVSNKLAQLMRECSVTLAARLCPAKSQQPKKPSRYDFVPHSVVAVSVRIVVYGLVSEKDVVSRILDEGKLFFQRPHELEYDRRVEYFNPMYLLRPGESMPRGAASSRRSDQSETGASSDMDHLGEAERGRILRIFDEAHGADAVDSQQLKQSSRIVSTLKEHQLEALSMMAEREAETLADNPRFPTLWEKYPDKGEETYRHIVTKSLQRKPLPNLRGGILADEMGLGKTLSTLALICHYLDNTDFSIRTDLPRASLIVTPKSTIYGWQQQIKRHIRSKGLHSFVYHGSNRRDAASDLHTFDVVLTTYDTLRSDWLEYGPLYTHTWSRVILDEAHRIRNCSSKLFQATCHIPAQTRWCLTGTPIQNSLDDFGSLLAFIGVPSLVTRDQFRFWISSPLYANKEHSQQTLRKLVRATCLRRTKAQPNLASTLDLPTKAERVEWVELLPLERELYDFFKRSSYLLAGMAQRSDSTTDQKVGNIIVLISVLRMICDHGEALLPSSALDAWRNRDAEMVNLALLRDAAKSRQSCCVCNRELENEDNNGQQAEMLELLSCKRHAACEVCVRLLDDTAPACPKCSDGVDMAHTPPVSSSKRAQYAPSSKVLALLRNIRCTLSSKVEDSVNDAGRPVFTKIVIFSHWTGMLDQIQHALSPLLSTLGLKLVRIDGSCTLSQRRNALDRFNLENDCVIMLATVGSVGEGIDLSIASEAHIVEPSWNPMAEAQAVDRVHRIGQTRAVNVIRYCVRDSVEVYIRWIQDHKLRLIHESLSPSGEKEKTGDEDLVEERWKKLFEFLN